VLVDNTSFQLDPTGKLSLQGILRHELGHTLGFRHEHTRPDSGACFEDNNWRPLTSYDAFSVMHYPQCNGQGDWALTLTAIDNSGAACVYDPAPGFTIDTNICQGAEPAPGPVACGPETEAFTDQQVAKND
jgi:serine protease